MFNWLRKLLGKNPKPPRRGNELLWWRKVDHDLEISLIWKGEARLVRGGSTVWYFYPSGARADTDLDLGDLLVQYCKQIEWGMHHDKEKSVRQLRETKVAR